MELFKKFCWHIIVWLICTFFIICGMNYVFHGALLVLLIDIIILLISGKKFQKIKYLLISLSVPVLLLLIGLLRMFGKILTVFAILGLCFYANAQSEADLLQKGNKLNRYRGDYDVAAKYYWEAAQKYASIEAINKLSILYSKHDYHKMRKGFDLTIPQAYIQAAADKFYPPEKAMKIDTDFIIIASENAIIGQAIWNLRKEDFGKNQGLLRDGYSKFSEKSLCGVVLDIVKKDFIINGKKGDFLSRSRYFKSTGNVALVDRDTALKQFDFTEFPQQEWLVYVRCPVNKNLLIPFNDFHRYVYENKMASFYSICEKLGPKSIKIYYLEKDKNGVVQKYKANGGVKTYGEAQITADIALQNSTKESEHIAATYGKPLVVVIKKSSSPWLDKEPLWKQMYIARHDPNSSLRKYNIQFNYNESNLVDIEAGTDFKNACWNISVKADAKITKFKAISWIFEIEFFPATFKEF